MSHNTAPKKEEEALESALSPIVNKLIDKNFENSGDKIATQMAPLIGGAIKEQIKSQKDDIVDALYPVMGNMISKFVTKSLEELFNKINEQIQNGLSAKAIKRKIKAKLKGVSETELLLQESSEANIKAALLIHKESGSLLCKVESKNTNLNDADMLASMMSAIRSFVNEWVNNNENHQELGEIEYGGNKIIIEASGNSYLAVIVEGAAYTKTYEKIRHTLEQIVLHYAQDIQDFQGSFENFPKDEIAKELEKLLLSNHDTQEVKKRTSPILFIIPLLLIGYISYISYKHYEDEQLQEKIISRINETPQLTPFKIDINVEKKVAQIKGKVPFAYHKELIDKELKKFSSLKAVHNNIQVIPTLTDPMQVSANIAYLLRGVNLIPNTNIGYNFDYNTLQLFGTAPNKQLKEKLLKELHNIPGITTIKENIAVKEPKISLELYFDTSSTELNNDAKTKLLKAIKLLKQSGSKATLRLRAYSDMIGDKEKNRILAQKRVLSIQTFLEENGLKNSIKTTILDIPPPHVDPKKDPKKARCITLTLQSEAS